MPDHYTLTIHFDAEDRPETWDVVKETPWPTVRSLLDCCVHRIGGYAVKSFEVVRNGEPVPDRTLDGGVELYRWPPALPN